MTKKGLRASAHLACIECNKKFLLEANSDLCSCGGLLDVAVPPPKQKARRLQKLFDDRAKGKDTIQSGVWRFREMLPPFSDSEIVSRGEGNTPLLSHARLKEFTGSASIALKHEGDNPTGSFKDRGMTVGVSHARRKQVRAVACASTGNTSASLACYAAVAGIPAVVFVPAGKVAIGKISQALAYGAKTFVLPGDFDQAMEFVQTVCKELNIELLNSMNPFRIEGQKTIIWELLQQRAWEVPDWIIFPAGNLGNTAAFGKALIEARDSGLIDKLPRLAAVQATGAAPFYKSFKENFSQKFSVQAETIATAVRIGNPVSFSRAVRSVRETNGVVTAVTDEEILNAKAVIDSSGIGCEPASACTVAGLKRLIKEEVIKPGEDIIGILTGHLLKDPDTTIRFHEGKFEGAGSRLTNSPIEIALDTAEVAKYLPS